jgi:hypothetical protein
MNATATAERCSCGAVLSRYREPGETVCAPCRRKATEQERPARILGPEQLLDAVAGLLLLSRALAPRRRVYLRDRLRALGIEADHSDIFCAVQKLRRRYDWQIEADARHPGHRLTAWPYRFTRLRGHAARAAAWRRRQTPLFKI